MPRGADDRYWGEQRLPSVFKHTLLDKYVPQFAGMTGSRATARRVVFLDGFAGRGRYGDGSPASAERILRIAQGQGTSGTVYWTCFFVELDDESAAVLVAVVDEYARKGVTATAHHGDVLDVLDDVVAAAAGCPLFLFLDPCGLGIPYERLVTLLRDERRAVWPPTEVLLNFSLEAVRRIGGHVGSERGFENTMRRLDEAVGGRWWRGHFARGVTDRAVETVVTRFGDRLARDGSMDLVSVPVRRGRSRSRCITCCSEPEASMACGASVTASPEPHRPGGPRLTNRRPSRTPTGCSPSRRSNGRPSRAPRAGQCRRSRLTWRPSCGSCRRSGWSTTRIGSSAILTARCESRWSATRSSSCTVKGAPRRPAKVGASGTLWSPGLRPRPQDAQASRRRSGHRACGLPIWACDRPTA